MPYSLEERRLRQKEDSRRYREKHKEKIAEKQKEYDKNNKEKILEYKQTENGKRSTRINNWKRRGLIVEDYNIIYDRWLNSAKCEMCLCEYKMTKKGYLDRCMEHNHTTGEFRSICCRSCNNHMRWIDKKK